MKVTTPELLKEATNRKKLIKKHIENSKDDIYFDKFYGKKVDMDVSITLDSALNDTFIQKKYRREQLTD